MSSTLYALYEYKSTILNMTFTYIFVYHDIPITMSYIQCGFGDICSPHGSHSFNSQQPLFSSSIRNRVKPMHMCAIRSLDLRRAKGILSYYPETIWETYISSIYKAC